jgi:hypothetical protein
MVATPNGTSRFFEMIQQAASTIIAAALIGLIAGVLNLRDGQAELKGILGISAKVDALQSEAIGQLDTRVRNLETQKK